MFAPLPVLARRPLGIPKWPVWELRRAADELEMTVYFRITLAAFLGLMPVAGGAQSYPAHPVRVIVPFLPGGAVDTVARMLAQQFSEQLGQQFIVENRPGASGAIGSEAVARSAADGYTLLVQASTLIINPMFQKSNPYDVNRDFTPVSQLGSVPMVFIAHPDVPAANLAEFITLAKASPRKFTIGTASLGSPGHLAEEAIRYGTGIDIVIASYKGTSGVLNDLMGGHVAGSIDALPAYYPHLKSGKLKALAVTTARRLSFMKDVPTVAESGMPGFEMVSWYGLWGPAKLPPETTRKLAAEAAKAVRSSIATERLGEQGFEPEGSTPEEFARYIASESAKYARLVKDANIKLDSN
jgi:tripartite-type tricarboxylate transporter receptor subunit TctC